MATDRDVNVNITATDETGPATHSAGSNFDRLQRKADNFSTRRAQAELKEFDRLVASQAKEGQTGFGTIQKAIDDTRTRIVKLQKELKSGGGGNKTSIFGDLKSAERDLKGLTNIASSLGTEGGQQFATNFGQSASKVLPGVLSNPIAAAVVAGVAVLAAPAIGALIGGAVTAGVGFGLLGLAAVVQKNNPVIQKAFVGLKDTAVSVFKNATAPLAQPFADALTYVDQLIRKSGPQLQGIFSALAPSVGPLVKTFGKLFVDILPGLTNLAKTFTTVLSDPTTRKAIDGIGKSLNALFNTIAANAPLIEHTFQAIGRIVSGTIDIANGLVHAGAAVDNTFQSLFTSSKVTNEQFVAQRKAVYGSLGALGAHTQTVKKYADTLGSATAVEHEFQLATATSANAVENDLNRSLSRVTTGVVTTANALDRNFTPAIIGSANAVEHTLNQSLASAREGVTTTANAAEAHLTPALNTNRGATLSLAQAYDYLYNAQSAATDQALSLEQSQLAVKQAQADLTQSIRDNGKSWNENTQAGRNNYGQLLNSLDAVKRNYDAQAKAHGPTVALTQAYDKQVDALLAQAQKAGLSKQKVKELRQEMEKLPATKNIAVTFTFHNLKQLQAAERATGNFVASSDALYWNPIARDADGGIGNTTAPARWPGVDVNVAPQALMIDGREVARSVWRADVHQRSRSTHRVRVGAAR